MQPFVDWIDTHPFYILNTWSREESKMLGPGTLYLFDRDRRILEHCLTPGPDGRLPYETIIYAKTKKSAKTTIAAAVGAWWQDQIYPGSEIYVLANKQEQATARVLSDIKYHVEQTNKEHQEEENYVPIKIIRDKILFPNGTFIESLTSEASGNAGSRHSLTLWDELWGFATERDRRLWDEMTPVPTVPISLRFVSTYAGIMGESDLLWEQYIKGVGPEECEGGQGEKIPGLEDLPCWRNGDLFVYWEHEPTMPWQTPEYLLSQMKSLRPMAYLRLHENRWVTSSETFIPEEWWDRATKALECPIDFTPESPYRSFPVYIGIDAAQKHDCMAAVGVTYDQKRGKCVQLFHKIWTPQNGETLDLDKTLGEWLWDKMAKYNVVLVVYDPALLVQFMLIQKGKGLPCEEFTQSPANMLKVSQCFYDLLRYNNYETYPDIEVKTHILNTVAVQDGRGFRLNRDKNRRSMKPMDFSIAAAMASYAAVNALASVATQKIYIPAPFSDLAIKKDDQSFLPFEFRE